MRVFIIAEAGVNHNGSIDLAKKLIDIAVDSGADAVKFQTFKAENLVNLYAEMAEYQKKNLGKTKSQLDMLKELELSFNDFEELKSYCDKRGITFLSTPFDIESARFLKELGLDIFKIGSGEITNYPLLKEIGSYRKKVILSTGMADLGEIEDALDVLIENGTEKKDITVLHCNTEYPTPYEDVNLRAMLTIKEAFKVKVGYSDHTTGIEIPVAAAALGASVIEKHFTVDRDLPGPDHKASLEPDELKAMVRAIRNVEKALGDGIKKPSRSEIKNIPVARKSIVAKRDIKKGEIFTEENLTVKRPGTGISPMRWNEIIGKKAPRDFKKDEVINICI
ncbi:MAG TPA: N-acetylneuraminate synthase [Persephonella sp.]|uniref:N-acetylneuraminate synthase n=1 Tax=Persephonella marina (strain DSM 14350 / EX-H1) TaxID=123214 RepID=C0QRU7_PERMH|nr:MULTISPECIES: N-acetylneuraminate synthase [Persephonella]ACO03060.1 N-acetylneuraminate synthase [Persephonella marina EX-H1]HCB69138.1 N-acetylneuraminate synthase [Persephonella sp.]